MPEYNGYPNRATWNVVLWLMNDEPVYNLLMRRYGPSGRLRRVTPTGVRIYVEVIARDLWGRTSRGGLATPDGMPLSAVRWKAVAAAVREAVA